MKRKLHFNLLFLNMFLSSILMVFIPITALGLMSYNSSVTSKRESFHDTYSLMLKGIGEKISNALFMLENDMLSLKNDMIFFNFQRMNQPGENIEQIRMVSNKLEEIKLKYKIINSIYFYDPTYHCIITNSAGSYDVSDFYDTNWLEKYDYKYAVQRYSTRKNVDYENFSRFKNILIIEDVYTIVFQLNKRQLLVVNVSMKNLIKDINDIYPYDLENYFISDATGQQVSIHNNNPADSLGELKFSSPMGYNNWTIETFIPEKALVADFAYFRNYNFLVSGIILIICIGISYILTRLIYSPVDHLIQDILRFTNKSDTTSYIENEIQYFKNVFKQIHTENELLTSKISIYHITMRYHLMKELIQGKVSIDEFQEEATQIGLDLINPYYQFIMISKPEELQGDSSKTTIAKLNLIELVNAYLSSIGKGIFFDIKKDFFITLISSEHLESIEKTQKRIVEIAQQSFNLGVFVGISNIFESLEDVPAAYTQCENAIIYGIFYGLKNKSVYVSELADLHGNCPKVPINTEAGLLRNVILRQKEEIRHIIDQFALYIQQQHNVPCARQVTVNLLSRIEKEFSFEAIFTKNVYEPIDHMTTLEELKTYLIDIFSTLADYLASAKEEENHYVTKAKSYLDTHFAENISITDVADHLNISYPYLCKLFKEYTNINMLDYLNQIRIEKSKELLQGTDDTIISISEKVGYGNYQSFQRFFKKITQMTPGEYRKIHHA